MTLPGQVILACARLPPGCNKPSRGQRPSTAWSSWLLCYRTQCVSTVSTTWCTITAYDSTAIPSSQRSLRGRCAWPELRARPREAAPPGPREPNRRSAEADATAVRQGREANRPRADGPPRLPPRTAMSVRRGEGVSVWWYEAGTEATGSWPVCGTLLVRERSSDEGPSSGACGSAGHSSCA